MDSRFETFTVLINRINRNIRRIKNREMAHCRLRSAHVSCLYYLYLNEPLTATELCECCEEDKATISRALDYLENNAYLRCESKSSKRYRSAFLLTQKGREAGEEIAGKINRVLDMVGAGLSDEDRACFYRSLAIISKNLEHCAAWQNDNNCTQTQERDDSQ